MTLPFPSFEALVVLDPENAYNPQTLGAIYIQLNNPLKALKHLNHALQLEAEHAPTLLNLTKALFMLGKVEEGLRLANILKNEPDPLISNPARALLIAYQ
jgi:predicted Zn-dependent protease